MKKKAVEPELAALEVAYHCRKCGGRVKRGNRDGEAIAWCSVCEPHFNRKGVLREAVKFVRSIEAGLKAKQAK